MFEMSVKRCLLELKSFPYDLIKLFLENLNFHVFLALF